MFGYRAYFVGRRMFACVTDQGVCIRVGVAAAEKALAEGVAEPFRPHGKAMRGWLEISTKCLDRFPKHSGILLRALAFTRALEKAEAR
jgi:TfoX/Sxy family transcriptional regulator of competence genes